jgi:(E)-4-hydroxy-3-methyl-but-2-enyl pyrophosphate reductase
MSEQLPDLNIFLAAPRGFCAGVVRAIDIVERALELHGKPVYVRHEIVHNKYVVEDLKQKGAIFVEELDEVPDGDRPVIFSAHGVPKSVPEAAKNRNLFYLDATCPLVSKVHMEASRHYQDGYEIVLIGHAGHPEVIGTMGQLPDGAITLVEDEEDVAKFEPRDADKLAYITQTTLSVDDTRGIIEALGRSSRTSTGHTRKTSATPRPTARSQSSRLLRIATWYSLWGLRTPPTRSVLLKWQRLPAASSPCWCSALPKSTGTPWPG